MNLIHQRRDFATEQVIDFERDVLTLRALPGDECLAT
jgi:hypothetical protein